MDSGDVRYVNMGDQAGETSSTSSAPSSASSSMKGWLELHRRALVVAVVVLTVLIAALVGFGLYVTSADSNVVPPTIDSSSSTASSSGNSSSTVHPACDGLYEWACADWLGKTPMPANRTSFSRFSEIDVLNRAVLDDILMSANSGYPLLDHLFASCMDTERIDQLGLRPLQPHLEGLMNHTGSWREFMQQLGQFRTLFGFSVIVAPAITNTQTRTSLSLGMAPLLLRRQDYANVTALDNLRNTISRMLQAAGDSRTDADLHASEVVELESMLNGIMPNSTTQGGATFASLREYSNVHFLPYLEGAGIPTASEYYSIAFPAAAFFQRLNSTMMATERPSSAWVQYTRYKLLNSAAPYLTRNLFAAFTNDHFPVREQPDVVMRAAVKVAQEVDVLSADAARYATCRTLANNADIASDLLGHAFMDRTFNATAYAIVESMIQDVRSAWTTWLPSIVWLDEAGRVAFQQKMSNMKTYIGGPPLLASYEGVTFRDDDFFNNVITLRSLHTADLWSTLLHPYDPIRLWNGSPASTVNAYYYSNQNAFYLYAGFFQWPLFFYDDYVANAPWTGEVIGHEAGHGFDASGILYNQTGVRSSWLSPSVMSDFNTRTQCTKDSYSRLQWDGIHVNGNKTITENMADIMGIRVAYLAYKAWAAKQTTLPTPWTSFLPKVDTLDQYFMAHWAQTECTKQTSAALSNQILNDVHAPGFARINGAAQLFSPMAEAFNCPVGSYMNPKPELSCFIY